METIVLIHVIILLTSSVTNEIMSVLKALFLIRVDCNYYVFDKIGILWCHTSAVKAYYIATQQQYTLLWTCLVLTEGFFK
jgi:hypothetical protein